MVAQYCEEVNAQGDDSDVIQVLEVAEDGCAKDPAEGPHRAEGMLHAQG